MSFTKQIQKLRQQSRDLTKEIARLKKESEFLAEASAFFTATAGSLQKLKDAEKPRFIVLHSM